MQINIDLFRDILADVWSCPAPTVPSNKSFSYGGIPQLIVDYHIHLLVIEGYLSGIDASWKLSPYDYRDIGLTMRGQIFLDNIRNDLVWNKIKNYISQNAVNISFTVINQLAIKFISSLKD